jgi:recombinational DNA repair protein (RecF pathway)
MSHEIYTTKGFVISSSSRAEADKSFSVFTKDLGLIRATAQGVRKMESKLRFALQDFSFCEISVVMTKAGWRLVGASSIDCSNSLVKNPTKIKALRLLKKLSAEDEPNEPLFNEIYEAFTFIDLNSEKYNEKSLEILMIVKILDALGYWDNESEGNISRNIFDDSAISLVTKKQKEIISEINKSLMATQLV